MLQNAYLIAKIGADTAENERNFAEIFAEGRTVRGLRGELRGLDVLRDAAEGRGAVTELRLRGVVGGLDGRGLVLHLTVLVGYQTMRDEKLPGWGMQLETVEGSFSAVLPKLPTCWS